MSNGVFKAYDRIGGVVMIEASKQLYAPTAVHAPTKAELRRRPQHVLGHPAGG
jgi:hypothetical protein